MIKSYKKICKKCRSQNTKKDGKMRGRQRYKCSECKHVCISERRGKGKIDTTYFGKIGLMVFKDKSSKKTLHYRIVNYETNEEYRKGVCQLESEGWKIKMIVCDGRRGLLGGFGDIPTQMCHFHQIQIVRRNITKNLILEENKELKKIVSRLPRTDKE